MANSPIEQGMSRRDFNQLFGGSTAMLAGAGTIDAGLGMFLPRKQENPTPTPEIITANAIECEVPNEAIQFYWPSVSPDGKQAAFAAYDGTQQGIYVVNTEEGTCDQIHPTADRPVWINDNYVLAQDQNNTVLIRVADENAQEIVKDAVFPNPTSDTEFLFIENSSRHKIGKARINFLPEAEQEPGKLARVETDPLFVVVIEKQGDQPEMELDGILSVADVRPNTNLMIVTRSVFNNDGNYKNELYTADINGRQAELSATVDQPDKPDFSPDGNRFVYTSAGQVYVVFLDKKVDITFAGYGDPRWIDENTLLVRSNDSGEIFKVTLAKDHVKSFEQLTKQKVVQNDQNDLREQLQEGK